MNTRRRILVITFCTMAVVAGVAYHFGQRDVSPPGQWPKRVSVKDRWAYRHKETEWGKKGLTPIEDNQAFKDAVNDLPVRAETSVDPSQLQELRHLLYDNMICRSRGDIQCYLDRCVAGRPAATIDSNHREWIPRMYAFVFGTELSHDVSLSEVFERFWKHEYTGSNSGKRFKELGKGSLIVIGDIHYVLPPGVSWNPPANLFSPEDLTEWTDWSGALRLRSVEMHPGKYSIDELSKKIDLFKFADVALVIRSRNNDNWCWFTRWYFDPLENHWELFMSSSVCSRRDYVVPL